MAQPGNPSATGQASGRILAAQPEISWAERTTMKLTALTIPLCAIRSMIWPQGRQIE